MQLCSALRASIIIASRNTDVDYCRDRGWIRSEQYQARTSTRSLHDVCFVEIDPHYRTMSKSIRDRSGYVYDLFHPQEIQPFSFHLPPRSS